MKTNALNLFAVLTASFLLLCSCQERLLLSRPGDAVRFTAGSGFSQTKAAYSGVTNSAGTIERIDWQAGDLMRIYCAQASEPAQKYADYAVTEVLPPAGEISNARIEVSSPGTGGVGLRWGEGDHMFYAVFPSPEDNGITLSMGISPYADGGTKSSVSKSISGATVTAKLPATQKVVSVSGSGTLNCVAAPDLNNMLMTAKNGTFTPDTFPDENTVFLAFTPLTTAVQFTIKNQTKADLTLKSVSLTSVASALNGPFTVDIDDETHQPSSINLGGTTVSYAHSYPYCQYTGSVTAATKTVTINFASPITLAYDANIANCGSLTFTFFLQPCQNFDDLTFKLVKSDDSWMSTKLGYTDGTGIIFPRFKKSEVTGLLIPEGAQWTLKYGKTVVTSWISGVGDELEIK